MRFQRLLSKIISNKGVDRSRLHWLAVAFLRLFFTSPIAGYESLTKKKAVDRRPLRKDPVFIIGHWRSGTSFLHYVMGQDPSLNYYNLFKATNPDIFLTTENFLKPLVKKAMGVHSTKNVFHGEPAKMDRPAELDVGHLINELSWSAHLGHIFPRNADHYFDKYLFFETASKAEVNNWKRSYDHLLRKLNYQCDNDRQIIIKTPVGTAHVKELLELYPNARFIYLHRDPYEIFYSNIKLWDVIQNTFSMQKLGPAEVKRQVLRIYRKMMDKYLDERQLIPEGHLYELRYEDFLEAPIESLRNIYENLGLPWTKAASDRFEKFFKGHVKNPSSYEPSEADVRAINKEWARSLAEWPYPDPTEKAPGDRQALKV